MTPATVMHLVVALAVALWPTSFAAAAGGAEASRIEIFNSEFHLDTPQTSVVATKQGRSWVADIRCSASTLCRPPQMGKLFDAASSRRISELGAILCAKGAYRNARPVEDSSEGFSARLRCSDTIVTVFDMDGGSQIAQLYRLLVAKQ